MLELKSFYWLVTSVAAFILVSFHQQNLCVSDNIVCPLILKVTWLKLLHTFHKLELMYIFRKSSNIILDNIYFPN